MSNFVISCCINETFVRDWNTSQATEHCITEHCITEHCITEHCITEHCIMGHEVSKLLHKVTHLCLRYLY